MSVPSSSSSCSRMCCCLGEVFAEEWGSCWCYAALMAEGRARGQQWLECNSSSSSSWVCEGSC
jgi:hypothetical protein